MPATGPYTLGRRPEFDERSRSFPVAPLLATDEIVSRLWQNYAQLDQGADGACVGFAWAHELSAEPDIYSFVDYDLAMRLYRRAQMLDDWPGENYSGTSVLAGAKAVSEMRLLTEYRWAFNVEEALLAVAHQGPVIVGCNWYESMFNPTPGNYLEVSGRIAGGHAVLVRGVYRETQTVMIQNSWGAGWGAAGCAYLFWEDFQRLLSEEGECCLPVVRTAVDPPSPEPIPVPDPEPIPEPDPPDVPPPDNQPGCMPFLDKLAKRLGRY